MAMECTVAHAVKPIFRVPCRCVLWKIVVFVCNKVCQIDNQIFEFFISKGVLSNPIFLSLSILCSSNFFIIPIR